MPATTTTDPMFETYESWAQSILDDVDLDESEIGEESHQRMYPNEALARLREL